MDLPNTVIGLIGFLTLAYIGSLGMVINYFLKSQKTQTKTYMDYIETKNGNLERVTADFTRTLKERDEAHTRERLDMEARLRECLVQK